MQIKRTCVWGMLTFQAEFDCGMQPSSPNISDEVDVYHNGCEDKNQEDQFQDGHYPLLQRAKLGIPGFHWDSSVLKLAH